MESTSFKKDLAILVIGVIAGILPWALDKAAVEVPRPASIGLVYVSVVALWWAMVSLNWLDVLPIFHGKQANFSKAIVSAVALCALALWTLKSVSILRGDSVEDLVAVSRSPTTLRLQFGDPGTFPTSLGQSNVFRWYALRAESEALNTTTGHVEKLGEMWTVYVVFDKPVKFDEMRVDGYALPTFEVKDSSPRSAIVVFSGVMDGKVVTIQAAQ